MPKIARLIGGAGTGKTQRQLETLEKVIATGVDLDHVGFVSFTRAARHVAASRAADRFGVEVSTIERDGWFRTLHSVAYRCLELKEKIIADDKEGREWLAQALQAPVKPADDANGFESRPTASGELGEQTQKSLHLWSASRNRLSSLKREWERTARVDDGLPPWESVQSDVERYEQQKAMDHRVDFTDLLGRFAGYEFSSVGPPQRVEPQGLTPGVQAWFCDEAQDLTPLTASVFERLIATPTCKWAYLSGDPFQSIYGWSGASPMSFMGWDVHTEEIMRRSYRCPPNVLWMGESILSPCSDYFERNIQATRPDCYAIEVERRISTLADQMDPRQSWLLLARSNFHAARIQSVLDREGLPWRPSRGNGGWQAPSRNAALMALLALSRGQPIDHAEWKEVVKQLPSRFDGDPLLVRGTKEKWKNKAPSAEKYCYAKDLEDWGATRGLRERLTNGRWTQWVKHADRFVAAEQRWGWKAATEPGIRVSTIHSAKGEEADNVVLLTTASKEISRNMLHQDGADEERRVSYVGATRARERLIIVREKRQRHEIPL